MWKLYSQPWSAAPRSFHGRLTIFREEGVVDILRVRAEVLGRDRESVARRGEKKASVTARRSTRTAAVAVVKLEVGFEGGTEAGEDWISLDIRKRVNWILRRVIYTAEMDSRR